MFEIKRSSWFIKDPLSHLSPPLLSCWDPWWWSGCCNQPFSISKSMVAILPFSSSTIYFPSRHGKKFVVYEMKAHLFDEYIAVPHVWRLSSPPIAKSQVTAGSHPEVIHNKVKKGDPSQRTMGRGPQVISRDSIPSVQNFLTIHRFLDTSFNKA